MLDKEKEKIFSSLLDQTFKIDLVSITLRQQGGNDPITYSGSGYVEQTEDGRFLLKLYFQYPENYDSWGIYTALNYPDGKLIDRSQLFRLEAIDTNGNWWMSENASVITLRIPSPSQVGEVLKVRLRYLKHVSHEACTKPEKKVLRAIFPISCIFPKNEIEKLGKPWSDNTFIFDFLKSTIKLKYKENYTEIKISGEDSSVTKELLERVTEALSIAINKILDCCLLEEKEEKSYQLTLWIPYAFPCSSLSSGIVHTEAGDQADFLNFLTKYLDTFDRPYQDFYYYWRYIRECSGLPASHSLAASRAYGLAISTSIEGLLKKYGRDFAPHDESFANALQETAKAVQKLPCKEQRIKGIIVESLKSKASERNFDVKTALHEFTRCVGLENGESKNKNKYLQAWSDLRNSFAHAEIKRGKDQLQETLDRIYSCEIILKRFLLYCIGFKGKFCEGNQDEYVRTFDKHEEFES